MNHEESRNVVLTLLRRQGKAKNSEMLALLGGHRDLFEHVREDLLFDELVEDIRGAGLRYTGPSATSMGSSGALKLFLSYGRRDAADLAERLEKDLLAKGYEVWRDTREIKPGTDFGEEILDGLRSSQIVVALMTPHSTRTTRDVNSPDFVDSICLGELAYALFHPPPQPVVPVMAQTCEPPLSIFHLDYVDLRRWQDSEEQYQAGLQRLVDGIEAARRGEKRYRSWHHLLAPFDFAGFLHSKRDRFTGRQWLFDKIDAWRQSGQGRALLIKGDPGTGKSAVVAELVHRNPGGQVMAYHCCQWNVGDTLEPWRFVRSVAAMIASKFDDYAALLADPTLRDTLSEESCRRDPESAFERGVLNPLQHLHAPESGPRYLLVDSLDEALGLPEGEKTIVQVLASRLNRLPPWLRIVATTRKDPRVLDKLQGLRAEEIEAESQDNLIDLKTFIEVELQDPDFVEQVRKSGISPETIIEQLIKASFGNFLYVRQALEAIRTQESTIEELQDLPPGLSGLYAQRFERLFPTESSFAPLIPLLEVICAAREPMRRSWLTAVAGLEDERALERRLASIAGYLTRRIDAQGIPRIAVYHKSFADWLTKPERDTQLHWVGVTRGNRRLAEWSLGEYRRDPACMADYTLHHIASHLIDDQRWDDLIGDETTPGPLTDLRFIEAKCGAGLVYELVNDYNNSIAALPEFRKENERLATRDVALIAYNKALRAYAVSRYEWFKAKSRGEIRPEPLCTALPTELQNQGQCVIPEAVSARAARLRHFANFVNTSLGPLASIPHDTLPLALNFSEDGVVSAEAARRIVSRNEPWLCRSPRPPALSARSQCFRIFEGHRETAVVSCVGVCQDGQRAVSSHDETLRVWNLETGQCQHTLEGHDDEVASLSVSPDGRRVVSASTDKTLRVWDLETGQCLLTLEGHKGAVCCVSMSPDGRRAVSGGWDCTLRVWDLENGQCLLILEGHDIIFNSVFASSDGRVVVTGSKDKAFRVWDLAACRCLHTLEGHEGEIKSVTVSPDGRRAVSGSWDCTLRVWDLETGECLLTLEGHKGAVFCVSMSPDGRRAVSGSNDKTLRVWDLETGQCLRILEGHEGCVCSVSVGPDGRHAVSGSYDGTLRIWNLETESRLLLLEGHDIDCSYASVSPDGRYSLWGGLGMMPLNVTDCVNFQWFRTLYGHKGFFFGLSASPGGWRALSSVMHNNAVRVWDIESGKSLLTLEGHSGRVLSVSVSPDGRRAVSGSWDCTLRVWDLETGECLLTLEGHKGGVLSVSMSPDGRRIVSGSWDCTLRVWDLATGKCLNTFEGHTSSVEYVRVSADGRRAFSSSGDRTLRVWDLEAGQLLRTIEVPSGVCFGVSMGSDGRRAVFSKLSFLPVWDLVAGQCLFTLDCSSNSVFGVGVSPDGKCVVVAELCNLRVWDLETGQCLRILEGHSHHVLSVSVSPDGRLVASASEDKTLRVWNLATGQCLALYNARSAVLFFDFLPNGNRIVCGTRDGQMHFLIPVNFPFTFPPIVTAVRLWSFGKTCKQVDDIVTADPGCWDDTLTALCVCCGHRFPVTPDKSGQQITCPLHSCGKQLQLNPFTVDGCSSFLQEVKSVSSSLTVPLKKTTTR